METVFLKNKTEILYLVTGERKNLKSCGCQGFDVLRPDMAEGAGEKHLPVIEREGNQITVKVGSIFHPMTEEHSIGWIFLETKKGGQLIRLTPQEQPVGRFLLAEGDEAVAAYAYCNLHGFWKTAVK